VVLNCFTAFNMFVNGECVKFVEGSNQRRMTNLNDLKPIEFWKWFEAVTSIPRPSKKEGKIIEFLIDFAKRRNLKWEKDLAGNVLIHKGPTSGFENRKTTILQSHVDMVCEKNAGVEHNFETDPITCIIDSGWVRADGTTLGADDGAGVAASLAILDSEIIEHGPLECLFTVDEETGLTGARLLEPDFISGHFLINLDSGDEGEFYVGCAGGMDTTGFLNYTREKIKPGSMAFQVQVNGLKGGHSGEDIDKGLANSVKVITRLIWAVNRNISVDLASIDAGNLRNAIPREGTAIICFPYKSRNKVESFLKELSRQIKDEYKETEKDLKIEMKEISAPEEILNEKSKNSLLNLLYALPHGVISMSHAIPGLVETSTNLASVKFQTDKKIIIATSQRSSIDSAKLDIGNQVQTVFEMGSALVEQNTGYPGWSPNPKSEIISIGSKAYKKLFKHEPQMKAVHAGLECGLFLEKYPHLEMISIGPTMKGCHSPDERMEIESVSRFWLLLLEMLRNIPE
jgi:dipeptidase D